MQKLTDRQRAVLEYISTSISDRGYPPTLREIGNHLGIRSTNGVNDHLRALERKGYLTREDMKSRTLRLVRSVDGEACEPVSLDTMAMGAVALGATSPAARAPTPANDLFDEYDIVEIPIVGSVAAGALSEAIENAEDSVRVDRMLLGRGGRDVFGLRIRGESMIDAGIHNGDFVFVRKQLEARRGDIVVALVGDEATCKYFFPERDHIRLEPANQTMTAIRIPHSDWRNTQILGVVVGVYRRLES